MHSIHHQRYMNLWQVALFIAVAAAVYMVCPQYLIQHHDGKFYFSLLSNIATWNDVGPLKLSVSHLSGMSATLQPLVPKLIPTLWPFLISVDPYWQVYFSYVLSAIFLYISTQLMARSLGFDRALSLAAAWTAFFYCMLLQDIVVAVPSAPVWMIWCNLMVAVFAQLGRLSPTRTVALGLCFVGLSVWLFAAMAAAPIIAAPGLGLLLGGLTLGSSSPREVSTKIGWAVLALAVLVFLRIPEFMDLLTRYTARVALSWAMEQQTVSFFNAGPVFRDELANWVVLVFGLTGATALLLPTAGTRSQRALAAAFLVFLVALTIIGSVRMASNLATSLPAPQYFVWPVMPIVALFAAAGAFRLLALAGEPGALRKAALSLFGVIATLSMLRMAHGLPTIYLTFVTVGVAALLIVLALFVSNPLRLTAGAVVLVGLGFSAPYPWLDRRPDMNQRMSLTPSPLTDYLRQRVGLRPGGVFAGVIDDLYIQGLAVPTLGMAMLEGWHKNINEYGNGYRTFGWHYFDIPTLSQYDQYITPSFFYLYTSLFNRPEERQMVNHLVLSTVNTRALGMMGVRYLVSNHGIATLTPEFEWRGMRVFGIDSPNLFSYSPTHVLSASDAGEGLAALQRDDMDPRSSAVVIGTVALPALLSAVSRASANAIPDGWRVHAVGGAFHMLLMPLQFSHCWEIAVEAGDKNARLIRANVGMTALIFENAVTAAIHYRFEAPNRLSCRRADYEEDQRIGIIKR